MDLSKEKVMYYDIIKINGSFYDDHCLIPWDRVDDEPEDNEYIMDVGVFMNYVAEKYKCKYDDIESMFMDNFDIPREILEKLPYGLEFCGGHCTQCNSIL